MYKYFFNKCKAINKLTPRYKMEQRERERERERKKQSYTQINKEPSERNPKQAKAFLCRKQNENEEKTKKSFVISQISQTFIMPFVLYCFVSVSLSRFCHIFYTLFTHITAAHGAP